MKKVLFTGFDPFGGENINPSREAVMALPKEISGIEIVAAEIPTVFGKSAEKLLELIEAEQPCAVICVGQAGGRASISVERIAINCDDASIDDNEGNRPDERRIADDGPSAYFATLPVKAIVQNMRDSGVPASISNSAGTFVCNHVMYSALHYAATKKPGMLAGFVHIPYLPQQVVNKGNMSSMPMDWVIEGLASIVQTLIDTSSN